MRQWDLVSLADGSFAVILQAELLDSTSHRVVAPLVTSDAFRPVRRLHLAVRIGRRDYIVVTDKLAAIDIKAIRKVVGSMENRQRDIRRALDLVFVGV